MPTWLPTDPEPSELNVRLPLLRLALVFCLACLAPAPPAQACGQQTHTWISLQALAELPDGPLKRILSDPAMETMLVNGSMFPDGGYAIDHPYGEAAHWAPFHQGYLRWIEANFEAPYDSPEAASHLAFLMGMVSHGIADEYFDASFYAASRIHDARPDDPDHHDLFDASTDILFAAASAHRIAPSDELPMEPIMHVYDQVLDLEVSAEQIQRGQGLLGTAAWFVASAADSPAEISNATQQFPWAAEHIMDGTISGSPPVIAEAVAEHWLDLHAQLLGEQNFNSRPVSYRWPRPEEPLEARQAGEPEARLALILSAAIDEAAQLAQLGTQVRDGATEVPHSSRFFYRDRSHVVVVDPEEAWPESRDIIFDLPAGLRTYGGETLRDSVPVKFSTLPPEFVEPTEGCDCSAANGGLFLLFALLGMGRRTRARSGSRPRARCG